MHRAQEPKYDGIVSAGDVKIVNRATGEPIPDDEPIFILRARDKRAADAIAYYADRCTDPEHQRIVRERVRDFTEFAIGHRERMKEPDSPR